MAVDRFNEALAKVLVHEGGYVNHPKDPGGATNRGVTQKVYDAYRTDTGLTRRSVREISREEINEIYRTRYWDVVRGDELPDGVDYVVFDGAVNSGPGQSVKWLQRALTGYYDGKIDGVCGPTTVAAALAYPNHDRLVSAIVDRRMDFLKALKTFSVFGKGWTARLTGVEKVGQAWATGEKPPSITYAPDGQAKGQLSDAKKAPSAAPGDAIAGGGAASAICTQAANQLLPFGNLEFVAKVIAVLTAVGVVLTVGGAAYRYWAQKKRAELADALDVVPL